MYFELCLYELVFERRPWDTLWNETKHMRRWCPINKNTTTSLNGDCTASERTRSRIARICFLSESEWGNFMLDDDDSQCDEKKESSEEQSWILSVSMIHLYQPPSWWYHHRGKKRNAIVLSISFPHGNYELCYSGLEIHQKKPSAVGVTAGGFYVRIVLMSIRGWT